MHCIQRTHNPRHSVRQVHWVRPFMERSTQEHQHTRSTWDPCRCIQLHALCLDSRERIEMVYLAQPVEGLGLMDLSDSLCHCATYIELGGDKIKLKYNAVYTISQNAECNNIVFLTIINNGNPNFVTAQGRVTGSIAYVSARRGRRLRNSPPVSGQSASRPSRLERAPCPDTLRLSVFKKHNNFWA